MEPQIFMVERMFEKNGSNTFWGAQFFRQRETFHVPTRIFFVEKEAITISSVLVKCYVMPVRDYLRYKPKGFKDKENRLSKSLHATKIRSPREFRVCSKTVLKSTKSRLRSSRLWRRLSWRILLRRSSG